jgi:hypothetical protein
MSAPKALNAPDVKPPQAYPHEVRVGSLVPVVVEFLRRIGRPVEARRTALIDPPHLVAIEQFVRRRPRYTVHA